MVSADIEMLVQKLRVQRVTFLVGAGLSYALPSGLPLARDLAKRLYSRFSSGFAAHALAGMDPNDLDLLAVADAIAGAASGGLRVLQAALADERFATATPNFGHRALALLYAESLIGTVLSLNYDTCIERAAGQYHEDIHVCRLPGDMQAGAAKGRLVKLHGCVERQETMLISTEQLDHPPDLSISEVMAGVARDAFVVVGIGSVAPYIASTIGMVWQYARSAESICLVSNPVGPTWDTLLPDPNKATRIVEYSDEFFDSLLRGCVQSQMQGIRSLAAALDISHPLQDSGVTRSSAVRDMETAFSGRGADEFILYFRQSAVPGNHSRPLATDAIGRRAFLALSLVAAAVSQPLSVDRTADRIRVAVGDDLVEFALTHDSLAAGEIVSTIRNRLELDRQRGLLGTAPILVVACGHTGPLPVSSTPSNLVAEPDARDLIDGPRTPGDRWVSLERITDCSRLSDIRTLVAI
jgi:hypothetical protein